MGDRARTPTPVRPLGFSEARMHCLHTLFAGTTQCVGAVRVRGVFEESAFRRALADLRARHALLSATIREIEGVLQFVSVPSAADPLTLADGANWQDLYQSLNSTPLPMDQSPWRVFVARDATDPGAWEVLLVTHHALMDGGSVALFMTELLETYAAHFHADGELEPRAPRPLPPAVESLLPRTLGWAEFLAHQARLRANQARIEPDAHRADAPHAERLTRTLFFSLEPAGLDALARVASTHRVTLNSWIAACLLEAVAAHSPGRTRFLLGSAFSLRALCQALTPEDLGCHLAVVSTTHERCVGQPIPDVAREHGRLLSRAVFEGARHPDQVDLPALRASLEGARGIRAFVGDIAYTYAESGMKSEYPPFVVEHFFASASRALGANSIVLHGLRHGGALHFTVNYTSPLQSSAWVDDVTRTFRSTLGDSIALA